MAGVHGNHFSVAFVRFRRPDQSMGQANYSLVMTLSLFERTGEDQGEEGARTKLLQNRGSRGLARFIDSTRFLWGETTHYRNERRSIIYPRG